MFLAGLLYQLPFLMQLSLSRGVKEEREERMETISVDFTQADLALHDFQLQWNSLNAQLANGTFQVYILYLM